MEPRQTGFKGLDRSIRMQKIVEAATHLFHRKGYKAATLGEVARELGLSKAALYHYVPSKERLLAIIYGQAFEKIFHRIYEICEMPICAKEKLRLVIRDHITNIITKNLAMFSVFFAEENQLPQKDFQKIREEKRKYTRLVEKILEEGIARGEFKPLDSRLLANAILGMCNWTYKWYRPERAVFTPEKIADHFLALLETGYLANHRREGGASGQEKGDEGFSETKRETYEELKRICGQLTALIDKIMAD